MKAATQENLFVYGTLRSGSPNRFARMLERSGQLLGKGRVQGRLYEIAEYPGLVRSEDPGEWVHGDVYRLATPETTYEMLDDYEGCGRHDSMPHEYRRVILPVLLETGMWIEACAYLYTQDVSNKKRIQTGDFLTPRRSPE